MKSRITCVLLLSSLIASAPAQSITFTPVVAPKVIASAYGKLPAELIPWTVVIAGPQARGKAHVELIANGFPLVKNSVIIGYAVRRRRLSWITWAPEAAEYSGWIAGMLSDGAKKQIAWSALGFGASKLLGAVPAVATQEKVERLEADLCSTEGEVREGEVEVCTLFTVDIGTLVTAFTVREK